MPKSSNQRLKLLYLLKILSENTDEEHGLTLQKITEELSAYGIEVERKTLYSDIDALNEFGVEIEKRKNKTVTYHMISRSFELAELKLLVDAVQSSKFISPTKSEKLIEKLSSLVSRHDGSKLKRQVYVSNRIKSMNESIYYSIDYIHEAINNDKKISFLYFEWNSKKEKVFRHGGKTYVVSPKALTWDDENYYLIAYDEGKIKHFRVDKMQKIAPVDEKREGDEEFLNFDMALYSKKTFGMFGGREERVTLRCRDSLAGIIIDRFGQDTPFTKADDGHFDVSVKVSVSPIFFGWVLNFESDIEIISPPSVRDEFRALLKSTLEKYD